MRKGSIKNLYWDPQKETKYAGQGRLLEKKPGVFLFQEESGKSFVLERWLVVFTSGDRKGIRKWMNIKRKALKKDLLKEKKSEYTQDFPASDVDYITCSLNYIRKYLSKKEEICEDSL